MLICATCSTIFLCPLAVVYLSVFYILVAQLEKYLVCIWTVLWIKLFLQVKFLAPAPQNIVRTPLLPVAVYMEMLCNNNDLFSKLKIQVVTIIWSRIFNVLWNSSCEWNQWRHVNVFIIPVNTFHNFFCNIIRFQNRANWGESVFLNYIDNIYFLQIILFLGYWVQN